VPVFIAGNTTPTIPSSFKGLRRTKFGMGQADGKNRLGSRLGSRLFEVNHFLWYYGRPKKRDNTVEEAEELRAKQMFEGNI
jgi:hypothetical protein